MAFQHQKLVLKYGGKFKKFHEVGKLMHDGKTKKTKYVIDQMQPIEEDANCEN